MNSTIESMYAQLKKKAVGYWAERILAQVEYSVKLSLVKNGQYDEVIRETVQLLYECFQKEDVLTKSAAQQAEKILEVLSVEAKSYRLVCAAHAHIDMNWLWGYAETAAITLDTFRTMLNLMNEYPDFKFSQSQASVYRIVEELDPAMLKEIKARVREGRWEVTATNWVETDKNMPNGESLVRHILYTKNYLSELLDLHPDSLQLDFEPDTFGHNRNVPEILTNGGVKYYYHNRGNEGEMLYRWKAPSGRYVIVYLDPYWYNADINSTIALHIPEFCTKYGIKSSLKVYGVGNHGGGPTRRDLERLIDMNKWPVFPAIRFGTFTEFFQQLDTIAENLPVVDRELNFVFTGCYTTQTRIKLANRISEAKLNEAEAFSAFSSIYTGGDYPANSYEDAWRKTMFNHFHDILPGSGITETREYAMGQFQQVLAIANTGIAGAMRNFTRQIDTSIYSLPAEEIKETNSEGAGVGYALCDYGIPQTERGRGKNRIFHFFNPSAHVRSEAVEVTLWDWPGEKDRLEIRDHLGNPIRHQLLEGQAQQFFQAGSYWGHKYIKLLVEVEVPAYGYCTCVLGEKDPVWPEPVYMQHPRLEKPDGYILENEFIKVEFDTKNASIISLKHKISGMEMADPKRPTGIFRIIDEDSAKGMTAWIIGRYMQTEDLNRNVKILDFSSRKDALCQWISYKLGFRDSSLKVTVSLNTGSSMLNYQVECDWQETSRPGEKIPQLNFFVPVAYECNAYLYDIPFGVIKREPLDMDVPANSWALAEPEEKGAAAVRVITNSKYGFRGWENALAVTLIRSSYDPDPYPENGIHRFRFALELTEGNASNASLIEKAFDCNHPISFVSGLQHKGSLPVAGSFLEIESGSVVLSAVKKPEKDGDQCLLIRLYETEGKDSQVILKLRGMPVQAWFVDLNEKRIDAETEIQTEGSTIRFGIRANSIASICIMMESVMCSGLD